MCGVFAMVGVQSRFQHAREECESNRAYMLGAWCLVCQDLVSCYFYFVLLPLGPELLRVMLYPCIVCVALFMDLFVLCVSCLTGL